MRKFSAIVLIFSAGILLFSQAAFAANGVYTVLRGDTMYRISTKVGVSLSNLVKANPQIADPNRLSVGQRLTVPEVAKPTDWMKPSGGAYPVVKAGDGVWLDASVREQRVYVKRGTQTIYTIVMSSGEEKAHATPRGTFRVEAERGDWFFSEKYQEGAKYWVSWKGHGIYLFHSVVMDRNRNVIESEARKLGTAVSHGCMRLTVPDAKWIYETIPTGTKVVVRD